MQFNSSFNLTHEQNVSIHLCVHFIYFMLTMQSDEDHNQNLHNIHISTTSSHTQPSLKRILIST